MIRVVADENIPAIQRALPGEIDLVLSPGRDIHAALVRDADALLVRSVTRVDSELLRGSRVGFVASATAGLDHVDTEGLERAGICFASAPGSNAESVAQYVAAALLHVAGTSGISLAGKVIGIVGAGQCGSRVKRVARALKMTPILCDPPRARAEGGDRYTELDSLTEVDFLTLHVPLTESGPDATRNLISEAFLQRMKPGAVIINTSRGGVVDEMALIAALERNQLKAAVVDAWLAEPGINRDLYARVSLGTPHIAGYSTDGKFRGTAMVADAFARHFELEMSWSAGEELPEIEATIDVGKGDLIEALGSIMSRAYPIERDSKALGATLNLPVDQAAKAFDRLRKDYPLRREFGAYQARLSHENPDLEVALRGLGFRVGDGSPGVHP